MAESGPGGEAPGGAPEGVAGGAAGPPAGPVAAPAAGGRPPPHPAAPRYAGFWIRALARFLDLLVILLVYNLFYLADRLGAGAGLWPSLLSDIDAPGSGSFLLDVIRGVFIFGFPAFYYVYLHGAFGQTFGKMLCRIRVVGEDGAPIGYRKALFRWLGYFLSGMLTLGLGYAFAAVDRRKRALHDVLCRTIVVRDGARPPA